MLLDLLKCIILSLFNEGKIFLMDDFRLTPQQIAALKALHRKQRDRRFADRINAIILLGSGWSAANVAQALLIDKATVRNWLEEYETELLTLMYQGFERD